MATRVAVLDDYQQIAEHVADWSHERLDVTFFSDHIADQDELVELLRGFEVVVAMRERTPLAAELIARLPDLRLIVTTGSRNASIATDAGVLVCGTRSLTSPTVELTWALILAQHRNLPAEQQSLRNGGWQLSVGEGLEGSTLGLLGLGNIGSRVARVGQAFGMEVIAWSQNLTAEASAEHGVTRVEKNELFARADVLSVHVRLSERTLGIVDEAALKSMKPRALLVNTSRAQIVDQQALERALEQSWIGGAALDVFDEEPLPQQHPLRSVPNALLTPHLGYVVRQNYEIFYTDAVDAILAFLDGNPIRVVEQ